MEQNHLVTLPVGIPNSQVNKFPYEQGFDEKLLLNSEQADCYQCAICQGIPRHPVLLHPCMHFFCEACIERQAETGPPENFHKFPFVVCAVCKKNSFIEQIIPLERSCPLIKKGYHLVKLNCPLGCGFIGDPLEMDEHETFDCELREVVCPSPGCGVKMTYKQMNDEHIQSCPKVLIHCNTCLLPVKRARLSSHNCVKRMAIAMLGLP